MADYSIRRRTKTFIEVSLHAPTNTAEVSKAITVLQGEWSRLTGPEARAYDDTFKVRVEDDDIVFYIEVDDA